MNKSDKKKLRRELEEQNEKRVALSKERRIGEDIHFRGIGLRKVQIIIAPSFDKGECWDIRELENEIKIYKSVVNTERNIIEPGYYEVMVDEKFYSEFSNFLSSAAIPVYTKSNNIGYCDGTSFTLNIENGFGNRFIVSWGENIPKEWEQFTSKLLVFVEKLREYDASEIKV